MIPERSWARAAVWGGGLSAALGMAGYGVWLVGEPLWGGLGQGYIPMASLTAFQFIIMGAVLWRLARRPLPGPLRPAAAVLVAACLLVSALALLAALTSWEFNPEEMIFAARGTLGAIELNRMSPLTAALFLLAGASLLARLLARPGRAEAQGEGAAATLAATGGAVGVLGYLYGTPLLYGGHIIPMAATTSAAFVLLGGGLLALNGPDFILFRPLVGTSPRARILRAFLPLSIVLILGHGYLQHHWRDASGVNAALFSALVVIVLSVITVLVALRVARVIGASIEGTEKELRKSRQEAEFLANLIERSSQPWGIGYPDGRLGRCNQSLCDLLGYSQREMEAVDTLEKITPGQWREEELAKLRQMHQSGKPARHEMQLIRKNGSRVWVEMLVDEARDDDGEPLYYHAFITDITERKRAEDRFKALAEEAPFSIIQFDAEGRVTFVNKWHLEVFARGKLGREYFLGKLIYELPGTVKAGIAPEVKKVLGGETIHLEEVYFPQFAAGHEGYQKIHGMPFFEDGKVSGGVLIREEITQKKRQELERRELEQKLMQSQKMEAIGTLAGGIAHDFNNMLASVMGYAELSQADLSPDHPVQRHLTQILEAGQRASDLVRQIMSFSRANEQDAKPLRLAPVIKQGLKLLRSSIPSSVSIEMDLAAQNEVVVGDVTQVQQILMNLCTNASQAMEGEGIMWVSLTAKEVERAQALAIAPDMPPGPYLRLAVCDSGRGISPEVMPRIFEPFFTTKGVGQGTGMGLSVVHGVVRAMGAFISVHSQPGRGATFAVYFPVVEEAPWLEDSEERDLPRGGERVLFVDDERPIMELGRHLLGRLGYQVTALSSSAEALELFRRDPGAYDLLITDYTMPGLTGGRLAEEVLALRPGLPIIICTGYSERMDQERARQLGARGFVFKPLRKADLARMVRQALDGDKPKAA